MLSLLPRPLAWPLIPSLALLITCWHLIFATVATQLLARITRITRLHDSRFSLPMTGRLYLRSIVPIAVVYTGSLVCSNLVYLHLSVAFIQMLKSASPIAVVFVSWVWGLSTPSRAGLLQVLVIVAGVAIASVGEVHFSLLGFLYQAAGIIFESIRLVMIQAMLSDQGAKMDPLVSLYYYAPICAVTNFLVIPADLPHFQWQDMQSVGFVMIFLNGLVAFMLNVTSVFLVWTSSTCHFTVFSNANACQIGKTSGLAMCLAGILKSILLIYVSVLIWQIPITLLQFMGYAIALAGLACYTVGYEQLIEVSRTAATSAAVSMNRLAFLPSTVRGRLVALSVLIMTLLLFALARAWPQVPETGSFWSSSGPS